MASAAVAPGIPAASARMCQLSVQYATKLGGGAEMDVSLDARMAIMRPAGPIRRPVVERLELSEIHAGARTSAGGGAATDPFPQLGELVFVERGRDGEPTRIAFAADVPRGTRQLVEYLVAELQVVGVQAGKDTWTRVERDTSGLYRAEYQRLGAGRLRKTKRGYEPVAQRPAVSILSSDRSLRLGADGALAELKTEERLRIADIGSETTSRVTAKAMSPDEAQRPRDWRSPPEGLVWFDFGTANVLTERERDEGTLAGQKLDAVLAAVHGKTGSELFKAVLRLSAFLRREPAAATAAVARAADADTGDTDLPRLVTALLDAGTVEADGLVARWLSEPTARAEHVASQLLLRRPPHDVLVQALAQCASDHARPSWRRAVFALGAAAALLRPTEPKAARTIVDGLLSDENAAGADRPIYLGALGATGDPRAFPRLVTRVHERDRANAEAATSAAGHFDTEAATVLLDDIVKRGTDPRLRQAAERACGRRRPERACRSLVTAAVEDKDTEVRRVAVDALAVGSGPVRDATLRRVQDADPDPQLRQYAAQKLAQIQSPREQGTIDWQKTPP